MPTTRKISVVNLKMVSGIAENPQTAMLLEKFEQDPRNNTRSKSTEKKSQHAGRGQS